MGILRIKAIACALREHGVQQTVMEDRELVNWIMNVCLEQPTSFTREKFLAICYGE